MLICNPHQVDVVRKKVLYIIINDPHSHEKKEVYISICYELFVFCHFSRFDIIIFVITVFSYLYSRFYKLFSVYEYSFFNFQLLISIIQLHISIFGWLIIPMTLRHVAYYSYKPWITIFLSILFIILSLCRTSNIIRINRWF